MPLMILMVSGFSMSIRRDICIMTSMKTMLKTAGFIFACLFVWRNEPVKITGD